MKAIAFNDHGTLDNVFYTEDLPAPTEVGPNDVRIDIKASALNRLDLWVLAGWPGLDLHKPHIMGSDGSGIITQIGANVQNLSIGDRVAINPVHRCGLCDFCIEGRANVCDKMAIFGEHVSGFYTEQAVIPALNCLKMPDHVTHATSAAASLVFVTAWHSLIQRAQLRAGEDVLIVGAGGGVNTASIQIARLAGAKTIYVIGSTDEKLAQAKELGADILINRTDDPKWSKAIYKASNRRGVHVVVDNVGAASYGHSLRALRKGGRLVTVGNTSGPKFEIDNRLMFGKHLSILGSTMGTDADYNAVMQQVFAGNLKPIIDTVYPLSEGVTALRRLESGDVTGKLVLEP